MSLNPIGFQELPFNVFPSLPPGGLANIVSRVFLESFLGGTRTYPPFLIAGFRCGHAAERPTRPWRLTMMNKWIHKLLLLDLLAGTAGDIPAAEAKQYSDRTVPGRAA